MNVSNSLTPSFEEWAFGPNYADMTVPVKIVVWQRLHGDVYSINPEERYVDFLNKIQQIYNLYVSNQSRPKISG